MGSDLISWRAAIGLHHGRGYKFVKKSTIHVNLWAHCINLVYAIFNFNHDLMSSNMHSITDIAQNLQLCFIIIQLILLIKAGDVELNPGPVQHVSEYTLSLFHCNIRSIRNKLEYIRDNLTDFNVLCFTETHLDHNILDSELHLSSVFDAPYRKDRTNHGGGILLYTNKDLYHTRIPDLEIYCNESIWIKIKVKSEVFLIGVFYSPRTADATFFYNLNLNIEKALEHSNNIIILGDLNENLLNPNFNNLRDILIVNSLQNVITTPTRQQAILDPILIPTDMTYCNAGVINIPDNISDHNATYLFLPFAYEILPSFKRTIWIYKKAKFDVLNEKISNFDWSCLKVGSLNDACKLFTETFMNFVNACVPRKIIQVRQNDKPWYDSIVRNFSRKRDRMKNIARKSGKTGDWEKYKQLRNKVNNLKKQAKENFYTNLEVNLTELQTNDKKGFWKIIRHFVKEQNSSSGNIPPLCLRQANGQMEFYTSNDEKANCLNSYFSSISSVNDTNVILPNLVLKTNEKLSDIQFTRKEIEELIVNLDVKKACGPDLISHKMLKECVHTISEPLHILFTRSLHESYFPDSWKIAQVTPLFKKGDKSLPSNYRPISLLSCCGKLFERIVFKYTYNFLLDNNLIYKYQSGFLPNHSTVYQLIDIYHHVCQALDQNQFSCMIFCDISKAFDRVWHKGLLFKLKQNGIDGKLLNWLSSYLQNRKQKTVIQSSVSNLQSIHAGVPQGSVLGPLLFLIYVNDITESLLSLTRLYADDSSLYCASTSSQDLEGILNHDLRQISIWAKQWLVNFNPSKTEAILFSLKNVQNFPRLLFDNTEIAFVESHKHLGVTLSSNGQWSTHIGNILSSAYKIINIMRKLKFTLSRVALNQIYMSYVRPLLEYSSIVWDGCNKRDSEALEKIQHEAARIVTGLTRSVSLDNLYKECCWESLEERRKTQKLCFMYKVNNNLTPSYINDLIPPNVDEMSDYNLRNSQNISTPLTRTTQFQKSCIPSAIKLWNSTDITKRQCPTFSTFKNSVKPLSTINKVPPHFIFGNRYLSVLHARIRRNCSNLNQDLYQNHLRQDPMCACNENTENSSHFLFECRYFREQRIKLFREIREFHPLNLKKLLYGDETLSTEQNSLIFNAVLQYIKESKRF